MQSDQEKDSLCCYALLFFLYKNKLYKYMHVLENECL